MQCMSVWIRGLAKTSITSEPVIRAHTLSVKEQTCYASSKIIIAMSKR